MALPAREAASHEREHRPRQPQHHAGQPVHIGCGQPTGAATGQPRPAADRPRRRGNDASQQIDACPCAGGVTERLEEACAPRCTAPQHAQRLRRLGTDPELGGELSPGDEQPQSGAEAQLRPQPGRQSVRGPPGLSVEHDQGPFKIGQSPAPRRSMMAGMERGQERRGDRVKRGHPAAGHLDLAQMPRQDLPRVVLGRGHLGQAVVNVYDEAIAFAHPGLAVNVAECTHIRAHLRVGLGTEGACILDREAKATKQLADPADCLRADQEVDVVIGTSMRVAVEKLGERSALEQDGENTRALQRCQKLRGLDVKPKRVGGGGRCPRRPLAALSGVRLRLPYAQTVLGLLHMPEQHIVGSHFVPFWVLTGWPPFGVHVETLQYRWLPVDPLPVVDPFVQTSPEQHFGPFCTHGWYF